MSEPQNTQAILCISYGGITICMGLTHTHTHSANFLVPLPPLHLLHPLPHLLLLQLDKRVFNKALGTHALPFRRRSHNREAPRQPADFDPALRRGPSFVGKTRKGECFSEGSKRTPVCPSSLQRPLFPTFDLDKSAQTKIRSFCIQPC